jgi:HlyD family secretion protein
LGITRGAVDTENSQRFVYVVKDSVGQSHLEKRLIQVGIADATDYEVISGLQEGEVVALPGDVDFHDGMKVRVVNMVTSDTQEAKDAKL